MQPIDNIFNYPVQPIYNHLLKQVLQQFKECPGFIVRGSKVYYFSEDICILLQPEKFRFNTKYTVVFWFNCKVFISLDKDVFKSKGKISMVDKFDEKVFLLLFERWSFTWGKDPEDYELIGNADGVSLLNKIIQRIKLNYVPFCYSMLNSARLISYLDEYQVKTGSRKFNMQIALFYAKKGETEFSKTYFSRADGDKELIKEVAGRFGVIII